MKRLYVGAVLLGLVVVVSTCTGDPNSSLRGAPTSLAIVPQKIYLDTGTTASLVIEGRDAQLNPVPITVTVTSANTAIAGIVPDSTRPSIDSSKYAFVIIGRSPGITRLNISGAGLTDSASVSVTPKVFTGALSSTTPVSGGPFTIRSTPVLKFDAPTTVVTFAGAQVGSPLITTADSLVVVTPFADSGAVAIDSVVTTYVPGLKLPLRTTQIVHPAGNFWQGDSSSATAPTLVLPAAAGQMVPMITTLYDTASHTFACPQATAMGPCMFYTFTIPDSTTLGFSVNWDGAPADSTDMNLYACASPYVAATCGAAPVAADSAAKVRPAAITMKFGGGTYVIVLERKAKHGGSLTADPRNFRWTIARQ